MEAIPTANPPSPETVWAILQEVGETQRENAQAIKELKEYQKETARQIGKLGSRMGEVIEYMVAPNLREKFRELGYDFLQANTNSEVSDRTNNIFLEIDVKLENDYKVMLVEVKTKPTTKDVQDHIRRLKKMRKYADLHGDKRTFLGAVAGVVMTDNVKEYVLKQGFFVIEPSGETFNVIPPNGQPKEW
jgi:hypothetical protein